MTFYKMTGSGNDFVMLDGRLTTPEDWPTQRIVDLCDRRNGAGADGLVILTPEGEGTIRMTFFNSDGSAAAMCGNAALCSTSLAGYLGMATGQMRLATGAGTFPTRQTERKWESALNLPDFALPGEVAIPLGSGEGVIWLATVGVPHLTILVHDVDNVDLTGRGRELRFHPATGPAGANANFVSSRKIDGVEHWFMRTYERGVEGETLACGTGAVASAVALATHERSHLPMKIVSRGGRVLTIEASLEAPVARAVWLTGEGRLVYQGELAE
ncbi:MAG: diaminopimelate epimerase [Gemmatimonadota bacterium]